MKCHTYSICKLRIELFVYTPPPPHIYINLISWLCPTLNTATTPLVFKTYHGNYYTQLIILLDIWNHYNTS